MSQGLVEEMLSPKAKDDIPYIYAKKRLTEVLTYDIFDKRWEGMKKIMQNGKVAHTLKKEFALRISGLDGTCKIPATPNNKKLFKKLCQPIPRTITTHEAQENGTTKEVESEYMEDPLWSRIDENVLDAGLTDDIVERVLQKLNDSGHKIVKDDNFTPEPEIPVVNDAEVIPLDLEDDPTEDDLFETPKVKNAGKRTRKHTK